VPVKVGVSAAPHDVGNVRTTLLADVTVIFSLRQSTVATCAAPVEIESVRLSS